MEVERIILSQNLEKLPRGPPAGSPLVQEQVQDCQVRGHSPSYRPKGPRRGKPSSADGPFTLYRWGSGLGSGNTFFRWNIVPGQMEKIKGKDLGKRKIAGWKKHLLQVDRRSRGTEVGRPFTGGYLFQVRGAGNTFFRWIGQGEYLFQPPFSGGGTGVSFSGGYLFQVRGAGNQLGQSTFFR